MLKTNRKVREVHFGFVGTGGAPRRGALCKSRGLVSECQQGKQTGQVGLQGLCLSEIVWSETNQLLRVLY